MADISCADKLEFDRELFGIRRLLDSYDEFGVPLDQECRLPPLAQRVHDVMCEMSGELSAICDLLNKYELGQPVETGNLPPLASRVDDVFCWLFELARVKPLCDPRRNLCESSQAVALECSRCKSVAGVVMTRAAVAGVCFDAPLCTPCFNALFKDGGEKAVEKYVMEFCALSFASTDRQNEPTATAAEPEKPQSWRDRPPLL